MPEKVLPGPVQSNACIREAVCIHTKKIYDSCRDKDCITDLRVYPTISSQSIIDCASGLRGRCADLLCVEIDLDAAPFTNGCYTVSLRFYYKIIGEAIVCGKAECVEGLAIFDKKVILYGSEGGTKTFSSNDQACAIGGCGRISPEAVVEALNPVILDIAIVESCNVRPPHTPPSTCPCRETIDIPGEVLDAFCEALFTEDSNRRILVTLGQFSIIRLERDTQLLIPVYDFCVPNKECVAAENITDPCELFNKIEFPVNDFFPPQSTSDCFGETESTPSKPCRCR